MCGPRPPLQLSSGVLPALIHFGCRYAKGLDCWGPVLNLARDPRWGRNGEAGSEDPYLTSQFSLGYTLGFQNGTAGTMPGDFLRGIVTLKWALCKSTYSF